jgi:hypothetical protein
VDDVLSKFTDFVANTVGAVERWVGLKYPAGGRDVDLFESEEVLAEEDVVLN